LQLPVTLSDAHILDLVPCAYQSDCLDSESETPLIETAEKIETQQFPLRSMSASSSMDDVDHQNRPLFKFEEYTIIERDSCTDFLDPVMSPSIDERQFLSILQDECFLSEPADFHNNSIADPTSAAARDPFHADWPYWDRAT
jgi:hypothetical protein